MTTHASKFSERSPRKVGLSSADLASWPVVDVGAIKNHEIRRRFQRLERAVTMYAAGAPLVTALAGANVDKRWFLRLVDKCQQRAPDGQANGFRALVSRGCAKTPVRVKERSVATKNAKSGYSGLFRKLLREKPEIERKLVAGIRRKGKGRLAPNTLNFRGIHRLFIKVCKEAGLTEEDYPLNTETMARAGLRDWIKTDFMAKHAVTWFDKEVGPDAAQAAGYGNGSGAESRLESPYSAWQIDEMTVDLLARYELPNNTGDWDQLDLERFMVIRVIAMNSGLSVAWRLVVAKQINAGDMVAVMWDAIAGPPAADKVIPGLDYHPDGGYPADVFEELKFCVPSVIYVDNALAHLADQFQRMVMSLWGATVRIGRPGVPQERAEVESQIKLMATRLLHQLPATTGGHPRSGVRKRAAKPVQHRLVVKELEQMIDVYLANTNGLPAAGSRYVSPLERLRRQLGAGVVKTAYLPTASRRPHLFFQAYKARVKVDPKRGRRPFVNTLGARYSSDTLQSSFGLVGKQFVVRVDPRDLRVIWLYDPISGTEWG